MKVNAIQIMHQKKIFADGSVLEMKLWELKKTKAYPDGIKYRLIFISPEQNKKVLMDNHSPKGHHYHINAREFEYEYQNIDMLIDDFKSLVKIHMGVKL